MAKLAQIGNSKGVRIPKPLIEQAKLENVEIEFEIVKDGLLLKPVKTTLRQGWEQSILDAYANSSSNKGEGLLSEFLDDSDLDVDVWEWEL